MGPCLRDPHIRTGLANGPTCLFGLPSFTDLFSLDFVSVVSAALVPDFGSDLVVEISSALD